MIRKIIILERYHGPLLEIFLFLFYSTVFVPDKKMGSCLDQLPGTGLQTEGGKEPGPPYSGEKSQLEPSRDAEEMRRREGEPTISHMMKEDQRPTE
jgi:hypothetical protein